LVWVAKPPSGIATGGVEKLNGTPLIGRVYRRPKRSDTWLA
jgi:hypothetical protein